MSNAINDNRRGRQVGPQVAPAAGDGVAVTVVDDGPGIEEDELPRVFEPFFRGRGALGQAAGAGIGLAVTRAMVEAKGGRVDMQSRRGQGSRFRVRLPLAG